MACGGSLKNCRALQDTQCVTQKFARTLRTKDDRAKEDQADQQSEPLLVELPKACLETPSKHIAVWLAQEFWQKQTANDSSFYAIPSWMQETLSWVFASGPDCWSLASWSHFLVSLLCRWQTLWGLYTQMADRRD